MLVIAAMFAGLLGACQTSGGGGGGGTAFSLDRPGTDPFGGGDFAGTPGEKIKIALLLPLSNRETQVRTVAQSLKDAAELALFDFNNPSIELVPKDTRGTAAGARFAAEEAINEGAELILGPLRAQAVSAAAQVAQERGVSMVAFSTTESVAAPGVFLLSFPPSLEVERIVDYAIGRGVKRFAALVPGSAYGNVVAGDLTRIVEDAGATLFTVERFEGGAADASAQRIAQLSDEIDAVVIAEGAPALGTIAQRLGTETGLQLLGTGVWNDPQIATEPALQGGWFPGPAPGTREVFEERFRATYGRPPATIASLAYDAVSLAAALSRSAPAGQRFTARRITDPNGFAGVDGLFRFTPEGRIERGLAILQVTPQGFQVIDPPPRSFVASNF